MKHFQGDQKEEGHLLCLRICVCGVFKGAKSWTKSSGCNSLKWQQYLM